ncbi:hypothetical protein SGFS_077710 [Streptomyces graminofaciens]|uniref:Uncharacterized protein n=1 Tax=Streptomyces graminofaciens TaxID=68212 RepID=A0ABN5VSM4_9ACTN|nr:hypothetical protein [Streptomyces graminofaciens]BBC36477.1 hypothetical protein SGFS_077710 [Streptomyces graminofaciens]
MEDVEEYGLGAGTGLGGGQPGAGRMADERAQEGATYALCITVSPADSLTDGAAMPLPDTSYDSVVCFVSVEVHERGGSLRFRGRRP